MHLHDVLFAADHRMAQGRDWVWDFLGRDCREIMFESYGPPDHNESFPVSAVFHCGTAEVRMLTVEHGHTSPADRWMDPGCRDDYLKACAMGGYEPWAEPGIRWVHDETEIIATIRKALHPNRRPSDEDVSYLYEGGDAQMFTEIVDAPGDVRVNG